jgi:HEAT repeat protein
MKHSVEFEAIAVALLLVSGCNREERGPLLAGGREVKSWVAALKDPNPQVRRQAVMKLGNVGDDDPAAAEGLVQAFRDHDAQVRRATVFAVVKLKHPNDEIIAQLREINRGDRDPSLRDVAAKALAKVGQGE